MKKRMFLVLWLVCPIVVIAYHYGPGQQHLSRDRARLALAEAQSAEREGDWEKAKTAYAEALQLLPASDVESRERIRLARAEAQIWTGDLPEAVQEMQGLLTEMEKRSAPADRLADVRKQLAAAQYYTGWLMRLENAAPAEWTPVVEESRQHFRWLAEQSPTSGVSSANRAESSKNLEAVIRLARMDLSELQALPLPKKCSNCKNVSQKCRKQRQSQSEKPGEQKPKDARGSSQGQRPDGAGS